jgi:hypothetical protein
LARLHRDPHPRPDDPGAITVVRRVSRQMRLTCHIGFWRPRSLDSRGEFVPEDERTRGDDASQTAFPVIVKIGATDAHGSDAEQRLARTWHTRIRGVLDADVSRPVQASNTHHSCSISGFACGVAMQHDMGIGPPMRRQSPIHRQASSAMHAFRRPDSILLAWIVRAGV